MAGKEPEGYAHTRSSYAPVARSSSTSFLEESAIARRWTDAETRARIAASPKFQFDRPSEAELGRLVQQYENITGDRITSRRPNKRNLVAACYRVHGADVIPYIADVFAVRGTAQNLLGLIRSSVPRPTGAVPGPVDDEARSTRADSGERSSPAIAAVSSGIVDRTNDHDGPPCPIEHCRPNLIYCDQHYRFGSHPKRRYDRRPSNPEAARYFGNADRDSTTDAATTVGTGAR